MITPMVKSLGDTNESCKAQPQILPSIVDDIQIIDLPKQ